MTDTIRIHCPNCGGGPANVPNGGVMACVDCRVEITVEVDDGWVSITYKQPEEK